MPLPSSPIRWIIPIAYIVVVNACLIVPSVLAFAFDYSDGTLSEDLGTWLFALAAVLWAANLAECIYLIARRRPGQDRFARRVMLLMKLGLMPFFCIGGVIMLLLMLLSIHPVLAMVGWMGAPVAAGIGWLVMLNGSVWAFGYALGLNQDKRLSAGECAVHGIAQLFFFVDVIDAVVLFVRGRKREQGLPPRT